MPVRADRGGYASGRGVVSAKKKPRRPLVASFPDAFKSWLSRERRFWSAHIKVDYDRAPRWVFYDSRPRRGVVPPTRTLARVSGNPILTRSLRALRAEADRRGIAFARVLVHRTRKGHHLRAWLAEFDGKTDGKYGPPIWPPARTVLALQAAANDDPVRQRFNRGRVRRGEAGWNVLFSTKHRSGVLIMEEAIDVEWTRRAREILTGKARR